VPHQLIAKTVKRLLPFIIIVVVLVGALFLVQYLSRPSGPRTSRASQPLSTSQPPGGPVRLGAEPPNALGNVNAAVLLEEFGDFECPPCGALHPVLKTMKSEFGSRLVIVFREYPMTTLHPHAMDAARAAEAAGLQGKFWEMHDLLYENQRAWHDAPNAGLMFEEYATRIGLNLDRFRHDATSNIVDQRIRLDRERGQWIGVIGTPTVFLDGREVPFESLSVEKLRALINAQTSH